MKSISLWSLLVLAACQTQPKQEQNAPSQEQKQTTLPQINFLEKGEEITGATQSTLLQVVSKAIAEKGTHEAVEYCNLKALKLVDSLSQANNCQIRRVSDKYRNPEDKAQDEIEQKALQSFLEKHQKQEKLEHFTLQEGKNTYYFKPIMLGMETCLKCHGEKNKDIEPKTLAIIEKLYPNDLAHNYKLKDFRGMWVVKF